MGTLGGDLCGCTEAKELRSRLGAHLCAHALAPLEVRWAFPVLEPESPSPSLQVAAPLTLWLWVNCSTSLSVSCLVSLELSGGHVWGA